MLGSMRDSPELRVRFSVEDEELSDLHARAFGSRLTDVTPWASRLSRHSLTWIGAFDGQTLVGFIHACWDGGRHAFLLDAVVDPAYQRRGLGQSLVRALIHEVKDSGCDWLHVDYEPHLTDFYTRACGFRTTAAGLLHLKA
jgi:ribosomal protein S18 acetylase RimI-like enzyme